MRSVEPGECFALLDDGTAVSQPRSRLYTGLRQELICTDPEDLPAVFETAGSAMHSGLHALLMCDYEFGAGLHRLQLRPRSAHRDHAGSLRILLFAELSHSTRPEVDVWLAAHDCRTDEDDCPRARSPYESDSVDNHVTSVAGICDLRANVGEADYCRAIRVIRERLVRGECYQINYTYRIQFSAFGSPLALYRRLRARQPTPYGALISRSDGSSVLSFSPELFVEHSGGRLRARPMKGTSQIGQNEADTSALAADLSADPKSRAENVMIVDLLRNDLGRIAEFGSVTVPSLFAIERHGAVLQMTSTVEATPLASIGFPDILAAVFPCGSITGAPKRQAIKAIDEIEVAPRGLYTGAIGWIDPPANGRVEVDGHNTALGDFCMSVAIRTVELDAPPEAKVAGPTPVERHGSKGEIRQGHFGVGGGIVIDSRSELEYRECAVKADFLTGLDPGFALLETIHAERSGCRNLAMHLERLAASAAWFGFRYDESEIVAVLAAECSALATSDSHRLRLRLAHDGTLSVLVAPLAPLERPVKLVVAATPVDAGNMFFRHKTTQRVLYDRALREADHFGAFDMLFFNTNGELTEGARSNIFLLLEGRWRTPPLSSGLLPGVMRRFLLEDRALNACESVLSRGDLEAASQVIVCNALRGAIPATLA